MTLDPKEPNWLGLKDPAAVQEDAHRSVRAYPQAHVAEWLIEGKSVVEIVENLVAVGFAFEEANAMVAEINATYAEEMGGERRRRGRKKALLGLTMFAGGGGLVAVSVLLSGSGFFFVLPVGLLLFGGYYFCRGVHDAFAD